MGIFENVHEIRSKILSSALSVGRDAGSVTLLAAGKMNSSDRIRMAISAGVDAVGENRVNEMRTKLEEGAYSGVPLHFIGHLQRNKAKYVVGQVDLIESVSSLDLIDEISRYAQRLGLVQDVLLEVNIGLERSKHGFYPEVLSEALEYTSKLAGIRVLGLMTIPPFSTDKTSISLYFEKMYNIFVDMGHKKYDNVFMRSLSMGMSDSYELAVKSGATIVRIGTKLFGAR